MYCIVCGLLFAFHCLAVATYALPLNLLPFTSDFRNIRRLSSSYTLWTSQWQKWNLFAPNPLRRSIIGIVEAHDGYAWQEIDRIAPETLSWRNQSAELKLLRRLQGKEVHAPLLETYLSLYCSDSILPGTELRLKLPYYVIPNDDLPRTYNEWKAYEPQWYDNENQTTYITCP